MHWQDQPHRLSSAHCAFLSLTVEFRVYHISILYYKIHNLHFVSDWHLLLQLFFAKPPMLSSHQQKLPVAFDK